MKNEMKKGGVFGHVVGGYAATLLDGWSGHVTGDRSFTFYILC